MKPKQIYEIHTRSLQLICDTKPTGQLHLIGNGISDTKTLKDDSIMEAKPDHDRAMTKQCKQPETMHQ